MKEYLLKLGLNYDKWHDNHRIFPPSSKRYTAEEITEWMILFERIGTLLGTHQFLKRRDGSAPTPTTMKNAIIRKFGKEGRDFDEWFNKFHQKPTSIIPYSDKDENQWIKLFEKLGSFQAVERYLKKRNNGIGPSHVTIIKHLKKKFKREKRDFSRWLKQYHIKYTDIEGYSEDDVNEWIRLFEKIGKLRHIENDIKEMYGTGPFRSTIVKRFKRRFREEGKNFEKWYKKYDKSHIHTYYTVNQLEIMKELYERIGSFEGVQDKMETDYNLTIHPSTIKNNLKKNINAQGLDFQNWIRKYDKTTYYEREVALWEKLYKKIGSFIGVSNFLMYKYGRTPASNTIERRIRQRFKAEGRDFTVFKKNHFQAYHEKVVRYYCQSVFSGSFPKDHPEWLINTSTGRRLELDGFNRQLRIAFEYNGPQHYMFIEHYHKTFQHFVNQMIRDEIKKELCVENKITLIIVPYKIKPKKMQDFIIDEFEKLTGRNIKEEYKLKEGKIIPRFNHNYFFNRENLDKFL